MVQGERVQMPQFGELEAAVMDELWGSDESMRVREVLERLNVSRSLAYTSVQTVMDNLARKGWLQRTPDGRANRYSPTATRDEYVAQLLAEALANTDDRPAAVLRLVEDMDKSEAKQLRAMLTEARRRR